MAITRGVRCSVMWILMPPSQFPSIFNLSAEVEFPVTPDLNSWFTRSLFFC